MDSFMIKGKSGSGSSAMKQQTINSMVNDRDLVVRDICRCIYGNALPFNLVKSPVFINMVKSISEYGRGLKPPTYHEVRVSYLKKEVDLVHTSLDKYKLEWKKTGCTLMSDGWTDGKGRSLTNFLVNSPRGTVFIKSVDTSSFIKDAEKMFELLDEMVMEIGEENVVQVVTDSAAALVSAGQKLMDKRKQLFWSPYAAHCLNLILEDIGGITVFYNTIWKAKKITTFIYRHTWVLNLYRTFSKGRELARPAITRPEAKFAKNVVLADKRFWKSIHYCLKIVTPLVKVLRLVDGDSKPAMGYIYEAMDRAKEEIAKSFNHEEKRYKDVWEIIDKRWDLQLHRPVHAATYFLNPKFHYDTKFNPDREVKTGLWKTLEKMCPDIETRITIDSQIEKFDRAERLFGNSLAIATRASKQPALWWNSFGDECKELQTIAIRILSLTCSATRCERNWSVFDPIHSKRRNRLEQQRLNALVFVKYNLQLEIRQKQREGKGDTYDPICLSDLDSDEEWITEQEEPCLMDEESCMDVHECFNVDEGDQSKKRKRGPRNLQDDRNDKGKGILIQEDVNRNDNRKGSQIIEQDMGDESDDSTNGEDERLDMPILDLDSDNSDNISPEI
ncbi:uncharacterized protein LOC133297067 [Gastrolobium bilobum]|uniref:uncharacterized protein LOC133297067 n=1 Tax=Gastrolobium bilobum TaxID=150636 RepID=UPI002AB1C665|nr:uncharacterized protein LOC133297067 [Gastrolobium bilobum]